MLDIIIDFNNEAERRTLHNELRKLRGKHRITIKKYRRQRTDRQNRFYHPCFCKPLADALTEQGQYTTAEQAHEILKNQFLRVTIDDDKAGMLTYTKSTTDLDVAEFNAYLDQCSWFLNEFFGIITPEPEVYHWKATDNADE